MGAHEMTHFNLNLGDILSINIERKNPIISIYLTKDKKKILLTNLINPGEKCLNHVISALIIGILIFQDIEIKEIVSTTDKMGRIIKKEYIIKEKIK